MTARTYDLDQLSVMLFEEEGLRLFPYVDTVGKTTIGIGRNLTDTGISEAEAGFLLHNDIDRTERALDGALPWWRALDPVRQLVLLDMAFNMGLGHEGKGLLSFRNTLRAMRERRWSDAAAGMEASKWARQTGRRARRLTAMMRSGLVEPIE